MTTPVPQWHTTPAYSGETSWLAWVGCAAEGDARLVVEALSQHSTVRCCKDPKMLRDWSTTVFQPPAIIILAETYPAEFSRTAQIEISRQWPLVPWMHVVGPWHEGEPRSGHPWSLALRITFTELHVICKNLVAKHPAGDNWIEQFTETIATLTAEERILHTLPQTSSYHKSLQSTARKMIEVWSPLTAQAEVYCDLLNSLGYAARMHRKHSSSDDLSVALASTPNCDLILLNNCGDLPELLAFWEHIRINLPQVSGIALLDFPREYERELLRTVGIATTLAKPLSARILKLAIDQVLLQNQVSILP